MTLPTSLVGPLAGALVDRWNRKWVMVGSDLVRAGLVFAIPIVAVLHISLVVGLVFLIAAASSFFRPARAAALPHVVPDEDLLTANSAMWVADTVSDLAGYGLGGLFVAFLGSALSLAFWIDGASYLASAALVAAVAIPPIASGGGAGEAGVEARRCRRLAAPADLVAGWRFLRAESVLFATTVQATIAEYGLGALTALSPLLVAALALGRLDAPTAYGFFEMSMGVGLRGRRPRHRRHRARIPKGPAIIDALHRAGHVSGPVLRDRPACRWRWSSRPASASPTSSSSSRARPSSSSARPDELLGRVIAIRLALVNVMLAVSMATSGLFAVLGLDVVLAGCGSSPPPRAWPASPSAPSESLTGRVAPPRQPRIGDRAMRKRRSVDSG